MNAKAKVSIIMPCFNGAKTIEASVASVQSQTYEDWELLIIDDGSADNSREIIEKFANADTRIKSLRTSGKNHGVHIARNLGLSKAQGRYISFLDCDDRWYPNSLELRINCLHRHKAMVTFGPYVRVFGNDKHKLVKTVPRVGYADMLARNHIGNLTGLYDRKSVGLIFQQDIRHEDYLMWCHIIKNAGYAISTGEEPLGEYLVSPASLSGNKALAAVWHWRILRDGLDMPLGVAVFNQCRYMIHAIVSRLQSSHP